MKGFEPPAPCSQSTCATRLRYTPSCSVPTQATMDIVLNIDSFVNNFFKKIDFIFAQYFSPTDSMGSKTGEINIFGAAPAEKTKTYNSVQASVRIPTI